MQTNSLVEECVETRCHAIVLWVQTLRPLERNGRQRWRSCSIWLVDWRAQCKNCRDLYAWLF